MRIRRWANAIKFACFVQLVGDTDVRLLQITCDLSFNAVNKRITCTNFYFQLDPGKISWALLTVLRVWAAF